MKFFPIKTVLFCILLAPLLYTLTLWGVEKILEGDYRQRIENHMVGDSAPLLDGTMEIEEAIADNIRNILSADPWVEKLGVEIVVRVFTSQGKEIYPVAMRFRSLAEMGEISYEERLKEIAHHNFDILNQELQTDVEVFLRNGTLGANLIVLIDLCLVLALFGIFYTLALKKARRHEAENEARWLALLAEEKAYQEKLISLQSEKERMEHRYESVKSEFDEKRRQASITEDEMFDEIVSLEKQLEKYMALQKEKQEEIEGLSRRLAREERKKGSTKRRKMVEMTEKRLATLYKNVDMNKKAMAGLMELSEEMQIKAEELIHQLNDEPDNVTIKRKVFAGKKNKTASFEVLFSYNGRLYFRKREGNRVEVLVIGTKNSQDKDMEFLHDL